RWPEGQMSAPSCAPGNWEFPSAARAEFRGQHASRISVVATLRCGCVSTQGSWHISYSHPAWPRGHSLFSNRNPHTHKIERDCVRFEKLVADNSANMHAERVFQRNGKRPVHTLQIFFLHAAKRKPRDRERSSGRDRAVLRALGRWH